MISEGSKARSQLKKYLDQLGLKYLEDEETLRGLFCGDNCEWHWVAGVPNDGRFLSFHACSPVKVPADRFTATAEYLMRVNWDLMFGNFDMDFSDGQVLFRTSIPVSSAGVAVKALEHLVFGNCSLMDRYVKGLLRVILGNADPKKALADAESNRLPPGGASAVTAAEATPDVAPETTGGTKAGRLGDFFANEN